MEEFETANTIECAEPAEEEELKLQNLIETKDESESPNEDDVGTKKSSALPILPIAAGGAALAVLLAVILLVVAKKRKAKKSRLKSTSTNLCAAHFGK